MNSPPPTRYLSSAAILGVALFAGSVTVLHLVQASTYDPRTQFMSELALGNGGELLMAAFAGLALALAATSASLRAHGAPSLLAYPPLVAAACFAAAGIVTFADSTPLHVGLVAVAFVLCGVSMYLLPRLLANFAGKRCRLASWGTCLVMCGATGLGDILIPVGIAQRLSALALLAWIVFVARKLAPIHRPTPYHHD